MKLTTRGNQFSLIDDNGKPLLAGNRNELGLKQIDDKSGFKSERVLQEHEVFAVQRDLKDSVKKLLSGESL